MINRFIFFSGVVLLLAGCTSAPTTCPGPVGLSCQPLHAVAKRMDALEKQPSSFSTGLIGMRAPTRKAARVLPVWLAPFVDAEDNYHAAHKVYVALSHGRWQTHPIYRRENHG